jgi:two-component system, NarL family, nitrate/nitrite response regulator NarL
MVNRHRIPGGLAPRGSAVDAMINQPVRIVIAGDHPIFRYGLLKLIETKPLLRVVGQADYGDDAVTLVRQFEPDLLLSDLGMAPLPGPDVLRSISRFSNSTRTILFTGTSDRTQILEALQLGVRGIVLKRSAADILFKCISAVMAGQYWVGRDSIADLVQYLWNQRPSPNRDTRKRNFGLTERELQIVATIASGFTNRDIAKEFSISEQTVKHHLTNIFDKTGVSNRLELALFAINHRLPNMPVIEEASLSEARLALAK